MKVLRIEALRCVVWSKLEVTLENSGKLALEVVYERDSLYDVSFSCADNFCIDTQFCLLSFLKTPLILKIRIIL